jgi:hypothetical protein
VLTAQHLLGVRGVDLVLERVEGVGEIGGNVFSPLCPLEQHPDVVDLLRQAVAELDVFGEAALPLQCLLRFGLVVPEIRSGDLLF